MNSFTEFTEKDKYTIDDLFELVKILRSENGCPWDKVQTHESIRNDFLEETCEVMEAIDKNDPDMMREELGDVLWQVCFHVTLEEEKGHFDFDDVCTEICRKLILRHPHVFGDVKVSGVGEALTNWDKIKKKEKHQETYTDTLNAVAKTFPALMRAKKVGKRAGNAGLDFENAEDAMKSAESEYDELREAVESKNKDNIEEELGDLLFSCVNVARKLDIDPELALTKSTEKFIKRFSEVEKYVKSEGKEMTDCTAEELDNIWNKVKTSNNSGK